MIATIDQLVYNTKTASLIAEDESTYLANDFKYWHECLYLTAKSNWFLHGSGGAMSAYAEGDGNHRSEGESIIPMTRWDALNWCEAHRAQEAIDEYFGDMVGDA